MYSREEQTRATQNEALKTLCLAKQPLSPLPRRREAAARRKGADISLEIETKIVITQITLMAKSQRSGHLA